MRWLAPAEERHWKVRLIFIYKDQAGITNISSTMITEAIQVPFDLTMYNNNNRTQILL